MSGYVLVIADDPAFRHIAVQTIVCEGRCVRTAATSDEAITEVNEELPELIVLDLRMPWQDCQQLFVELGRLACNMPVVIASDVSVVGPAIARAGRDSVPE
jgi:DNA-binding NtrC family response regulator